jgi:colanic acid/amylovoran biosynthesis glycosyltransferase
MKIAYLLHRFPGLTDTFIKREIRCLQEIGTEVEVISVWKPNSSESTPEMLGDWSKDVSFLLPRSFFSILRAILTVVLSSPRQVLATIWLAAATSRPGVRGIIYQFFYVIEAILAAEVLRKRSINHIHNHFGDHSGTVTMLASKLTNIKYSISFHGPHVFFDAKSGAIKRKVDQSCFIRCISYFCRSQLMVLCETENLSEFKVVHCGLELERYQFRLPREQVQKIFCAARLAPEKGIEFLVEALAVLIRRNYDVRLRIAGGGPSRLALENLAQKLGVMERVQFLGMLSEQDLTHELSSSDLFVLPSFAEGLPVSVMEAMALGVPVIATNVAGTSELVENGETGLLVRPTDSEALANAMITMMGDYDLRRRSAQLGRAKVAREFDIVTEVKKLNDRFLLCCEPSD